MDPVFSNAVALAALVVSLVALLITRRQLVLQRDEAGGRGFLLGVSQPSRAVINDKVSIGRRVMVKLAGNPRHEVSVLLEREGRQLEEDDPDYVEPMPIRHVMTAEDEPIVWRFELSPEAVSTLWCVIAWGEPFGQGIRTQAFKTPLNDGDQFWEWKWFRFYRQRRAIESWLGSHGPRWFRRIAGRPRRLGKWRRYDLRPLRPGQSPIDSGVVPS